MTKRRARSFRPRHRRHLREVGITAKTRTRYRNCVRNFFHYLRDMNRVFPSSPEHLDFELAEYINHLWEDDHPEGVAADTLSGLRRLLPACRNKLPTSVFYFQNWRRSVHRVRALPITSVAIKGLAGLCYFRNRPDLAAMLLLGFTALLRTSELLYLRHSNILVFPQHSRAIVILPHSKSGSRFNITEKVVITDPYVINALLLARPSTQGDADDRLYRKTPSNFGAELRELGGLVGLPTQRLTPYSLRRGGATWHFSKYGQLSRTTLLGRWQNERTARIYIDQALAEQTLWSLSSRAAARPALGSQVASSLLQHPPEIGRLMLSQHRGGSCA